MLGHASYVTTLTVYADYITESDGGKAVPLCRPVASTVAGLAPAVSMSIVIYHARDACLAQFICRTELL